MSNYENAWRSKRLHYRALETPTHDAFMRTQSLNAASTANSSLGLLKPPSRQNVKTLMDWAIAQLLAVVMCLPKGDPAVVKAQGLSEFAAIAAAAAGPSPAVDDDDAFVPIGMIFLQAPLPAFQHHRNSTIGLDVIAPYQRQGFGTEAIEWILNWGFQLGGLHKININCFSYNEGARRLYERLGFTVEGVRRECVWFDGSWHDEVEMGMLDREWKAQRGKDEKDEASKSVK